MGAEEIVVSNEEDELSDGAGSAAEAILGVDVIFVGSVESFDHLFKGSELFGFGVKVFQTDNLFEGQIKGLNLGIDEMQAGLIRGVAVGDEGDGLVLTGCGDGFKHGCDGVFGSAAIREVIGGDFMGF